MHTDVVDLREFYLSSQGRAVRNLLRRQMQQLWPQIRGERVLAIGYGLPLLRPLLTDTASLMAMMPVEQGAAYWPREGPNITCFVDTKDLPLPDDSVDRIILMHALEGAAEPNALLREMWRVMKSGGRLLAVVPNRRGLWAHSDRTPFGTGRPYSGFQIRDTLRDHGFLINRMRHALYLPPTNSRMFLSVAHLIDQYGELLIPGLGGVMMIEAGKQLYAPLLAKARATSRRLVLPLPPLSGLPGPVPT